MAVAQAPVRQPAPLEAFGWASGAHIKADPQQAAAVVKTLYEEHGRVEPALLLEASRPKGAVLHDEFEWTDKRAAESYRLAQARYILRSLVVRYVSEERDAVPGPMRYVVKLQAREGDEANAELEAATAPHVYLPVSVVQASPSLRERWVAQAARELASWRQRYHEIEQLAGVSESLDLIQQRLMEAE